MVSVSSRNGQVKAQLRAENKQGARLSLGKRVFRVRAELRGLSSVLTSRSGKFISARFSPRANKSHSKKQNEAIGEEHVKNEPPKQPYGRMEGGSDRSADGHFSRLTLSAGLSPQQPMRVRSQSTTYPIPMKPSAILARCLMDADGVR